MVATRNHPREFPSPTTATTSPDPSPRKRTTRSTTTTTTTTSSSPPPPTRRTTKRATWSHTPSTLTLLWLALSLPLVIWDTGYVLLRPHTMPGGFLHKPLYTPYALYGTVDHMYGLKHWELRTGWTLAQGVVNALETVGYGVYLYLVYVYGTPTAEEGRGAPGKGMMGGLRALSEARVVEGAVAGGVVVLGYTVSTVTFWKTVLYWLNEWASGFDNIGHNDFLSLVFLWVIPNVAWIIFPGYMSYVFGQEILQGLEMASGKKSR